MSTTPEALTALRIADASPPAGRLARVVRALASSRTTLVVIACLTAAVVVCLATDVPATWLIAAPLVAVAVNLCAAVATNRAFRRQGALLAFHLALIAVVLLAAVGRMTYLRGRAEVTTGVPFAGVLVESESGPWHGNAIERIRFTSAGFTVDYEAGMRRAATRNVVRWTDADGAAREATVGDQTPLAIDGYRFHTSHNKGFAARLTWIGADGLPQRSTLHFPSYPVFESSQRVEWNLPENGAPVTLKLEIDEVLIPLDRPAQFRLPARPALVVEANATSTRVDAGGILDFGNGRLRFDGLTTWMGYSVDHDPTRPWMLAACVVAIASLAWHLRGRFAREPWSPT